MFLQLVHVDQHAGLLHAREHGHQRHLDLVEYLLQLRLGFELRPQRVMQAQRDIRIFGRILGSALHVDLREGDLFCTFSCHVFVVDGVHAEVFFRQRVHVVAIAG